MTEILAAPLRALADVQASCLAHVINLATQALIKGHSKAKYYSPTKPDEHVPDVDAILRDEVGLIRAIAVKVSPLCCESYPGCQISYSLRNDRLLNGRSYSE